MGFMINIIWTLAILGIIIFFHELGHFLAAKKLGIKVERFSIGFGPKLVGFTRGDTEYRISWLPLLGGYVKMLGENPADRPDDWFQDTLEAPSYTPEQRDVRVEEAIPEKGRFDLAPVSHRAIVALSGPGTNIILAVLMFALAYMVGLPADPDTTISYVDPDSPALAAGIMRGDKILSIDGYKVKTWSDIQENVFTHPDKELDVTLLRNESENINLRVTPERVEIPVISISLDLQSELDSGVIPMDLRQEFDVNKITPLSPYAIISVEEVGSEWLITDVDRYYAIREENDRLGIYMEMVGTGPELAFSVDLANRDILVLQNDLNNSIVSEGLRRKFDSIGTSLPTDSAISLEEADNTWLITGKSYARGILRWLIPSKEKRYHVRLEKDKLNVYQETAFGMLGVGHSDKATVQELKQDSIVAEAGLHRGDIIEAVNNKEVEYNTDFVQEIQEASDESVTLTVRRDNSIIDISIPLEYDEQLVFVTKMELSDDLDDGVISEGLREKFENNKLLLSDNASVTTEEANTKWLIANGDNVYIVRKKEAALNIYDNNGQLVSFAGLSFEKIVHRDPITAFRMAVPETIRMGRKIFQFLKRMIVGDISTKYIAGPVGIVQIAFAIVATGVASTLRFAGFLSVNLGIVNLLPLFITDGAMLVLLVIEKLRRKPMELKKQMVIQQIGFGFILLLFLLVTYNDIIRLIAGGM